jgi:glycosyltransferase involved in cell wall biosynthesis
MPLFSVIIPAYNRAELIGAAMDSVLAQEIGDWEMIVVDDGSSDRTVEVVEQYAARNHERIILLRQPNQGPGAARNTGIARATGTYTTFLDSDDVWFPWTLRTLAQAIERYDQPVFLAGTDVRFEGETMLPQNGPRAMVCERFKDYYTAANREELWIGICAAAIRTDRLRSVGGFTDRRMNSEDSDLWMKLGVAPGFVRVRSPALFGYRQHGESAVSNLDSAFKGGEHLIDQESSGQYPGGKAREAERLRILGAHVRPVSVACLKRGRMGWGFRIFRRTFGWHVRLRRFKYLVAFPVMAITLLILPGKKQSPR